MQFVYTAEGAEPKTWPLNTKKLMNAEAAAIERLTGMTFSEWEDKVSRGSMIATHALLWVMLKRDTPTLKPDEVVFSAGEVSVELDDEESAALLEQLEAAAKTRTLTAGEESILALLRETAPQAALEPVEGSDEAEEPAPKD